MRKKILLWVLFAVIIAFGVQYKDKKVLWSAAGDPVYVPGSTEITTLGTITTGTWQGSSIDISGATNLSVTAPITLTGDVVGLNQTGITSLGTIGAGVWQGTAIDGAYIDIEGTEVKSTGEGGGTKFLREDGDGTSSWQIATATVEGTAVLSTGEGGGTKYLREDGDGTSSWQIGTTGDVLKDIVTTAPLTVNAGASLNDVLPGADADVTFAIGDADDDGVTKGVASFDNTDFDAVAGNVTIVDDGHTHTATSITGLPPEGTAILSTGPELNTKYLRADGAGGASWETAAGGNHAILDGSIHSDSVADAVTRGSIIYGNATPKWDELVVGGAGTVLTSDGTDVSWQAAGTGSVEDDVYGAGWDGDITHAPSQNSVYDKVSVMDTDVTANTAARHTRSHTMTSTSDHTAGIWKLFASNGAGEVTEITHGSSGKVLTGTGVTAAPTWQTPSTGGRNWSIVNSGSVDQCDDDNLDSVADLVSEIGANPGTLFFGHTSGNAQTTYSFDGPTCGNIPKNISIVIEEGAVLDLAGNNQQILGDVQAGFYKVFSQAGAGKFLFGKDQNITNTGKVREVYPDWWGADVDGVTDDGPEIQKAIDSLNDNGGIVFLRAGVWHVHTQINVKRGVTIQGTGWSRSPWVTEMSVSDLRAGTWIAQDSNITIFHIVYNGTAIKDLAFYQQHPNPLTEAAWNPTAYTSYLIVYHYDVTTAPQSSRPDNTLLENLLLLNIYNGIKIDYTGEPANAGNEGASLWMRDIRAQCFNRFFTSEWNWGGIQVKNVDLWVYWSAGWADNAESAHYRNVLQDMKGRLIAFDIQMADGAHFDNVKIYGAAYGFYLSRAPAVAAGACDGTFADPDCTIDEPRGLMMNQIWMENLQLGIAVDINITGAGPWRNVEINNLFINGENGLANSWGIYVNGDGYVFSINNAWLYGFNGAAIIATSNATGNVFLIDNVHIDAWDGGDTGAPAIAMNAGNTAYIGNNMFYENAGPGDDAPWLGGAGTFYTSAGSYYSTVIVASAGTIAIPPGATKVVITGTTTITAITGGYNNRIIVLEGSANPTRQITDGGTLNLAGNMDLADNTNITLIASSATAWSEISRSAN